MSSVSAVPRPLTRDELHAVVDLLSAARIHLETSEMLVKAEQDAERATTYVDRAIDRLTRLRQKLSEINTIP